jgi:PAS domain S-box-containing protein
MTDKIDSRTDSNLKASLAAIVESSDDAIVGKTLEGVITAWNPSAERIFGYGADEAIGRHITLIIPKDRHDEETVILGKVRSGERLEHFETVRQHKNGSLIDVSLTISPIRDETGKIVGASKVARDISETKRAERASAYLAAIVDSSDDAIVSKDLNGIITTWNRAAEQMFGYTSAEAVGQSILLIIPPHLRDEETTIIGRVKAGQKVDHFETVRRTKSGELINISLTVSPIFDRLGRIVGASKIARNITLQARMEAQLRLATEAGDIGLWDLDTTTNNLFWDARCKAMFGISAAVPVTMDDFYTGLHPDDHDKTVEALKRAIDPNLRAPYNVEYRTIGKEDSVLRWIAAKGRGVFDTSGVCIRAMGTTIDITDRKRDEVRLRQLNRDLEEMVAERTAELNRVWQYSRDLAVVVDMEGIIRSSSPASIAILGRQPDEAIGKGVADFIWPEDIPEAEAGLARALSGEELTDFQIRLLHADGSARWISWRTTREADFVYAYGRDITSEKLQSEALRHTEEALRQSQKMEAVGQLTGGIAHDFNNMLAVVMGSLDLLGRRIGHDDPRARRFIDAAVDGAKRAANLTKRLLAFSRQQPLQPEVLNVNSLVSGMSELLRHSIGADIRLETVLAGGLWPANVDPNQLENVIVNLAVNARDAMPEGGRLTIETHNAHLDDRYATAHIGIPKGHYVMIAVTDTGSGMSPDVLAKAFDPFFTTKMVGKGTGLGLSQVYGFVKQSGGHVKIYSEPGPGPNQGTTVKIYLQRTAEPEPPLTESESRLEPLAGGHRETVLVVDDEQAVRQFSVDAFCELGYEVLEADSADTAMKLLRSHPEVDLLFTDVVMPDVNGRLLVDRAHALRPDLKVLFTTGYTRNAVVHNGVLDPDVELIGKPFTLDELAFKVRALLD